MKSGEYSLADLRIQAGGDAVDIERSDCPTGCFQTVPTKDSVRSGCSESHR